MQHNHARSEQKTKTALPPLQKTLMMESAYFAWWAMTTLAPKTLWMIWILSA